MANTDSLINIAPSLFKEHLLKPTHSSPIFREGTTSYWPSIVLFVVFAIYVAVKAYDVKKLMKVLGSVFSLQMAKQLYREDYKPNKRMSILLTIGFIAMLSFLIYTINKYFGIVLNDYSSLNQYLFFVLVVIGTYTVKLIINSVLSNILTIQELGREYSFNIFTHAQTTGIILFPMLLCIQYAKYPTEWFIYPAVIICLGLYLMRLFRGFVISALEQNVGVIYIFLYLCALEILPVLVLIKFLLNNF